MQDPALMSVLNRPRDLGDVGGGLPCRQRTVPHQLGQTPPRDVVHRKVRLTVGLANLVDGDDVRVLELGDGLGFTAEPLERRLSRELAEQHHLDRHAAIQADLPGAVHHAHAAVGDLVQQFVVAETGPVAQLRVES